MRELPFIISGYEALAFLQGKRTQMRRLVIPQPERIKTDVGVCKYVKRAGGRWVYDVVPAGMPTTLDLSDMPAYECPFEVGDILWAQETFYVLPELWQGSDGPQPINYAADLAMMGLTWSVVEDYKIVPPGRMPRWASRFTWQIKHIGFERLQEISEAGAVAEGIQPDENFGTGANPGKLYAALPNKPVRFPSARDAFSFRWDTLYARHYIDDQGRRWAAWESNPLVRVMVLLEVQKEQVQEK